MPICKICFETKPEVDFFKLKNFHKYHLVDVEWCKDCQKMFIDMKKEKKRREEFLAIPFNGKVEFK